MRGEAGGGRREAASSASRLKLSASHVQFSLSTAGLVRVYFGQFRSSETALSAVSVAHSHCMSSALISRDGMNGALL